MGDDDEGNSPGAEESREWNESREPDVALKPKYGLDGEDLADVWGNSEPLGAPRENP